MRPRSDHALSGDGGSVKGRGRASAATLQGLGHLVRDPQLLLGPHITREAVASSRIEGTQTSLAEVLRAEVTATEDTDEDVAEVERYVEATRLGLELIEHLPITQRLIKQVHRVLLSDVRGADKLPGEFRRSPVWVDSPTASPDTATFVPPLLYLSGYLEAHRREYYDRLQAVRERGEIQQWLQFFLTAVTHQAQDAVSRAARIVALRERYLLDSARSRSRLPELIDVLLRNPYVTVARVQREIGLTNQGARNLIRDAEKRGWLTELRASGRGGRAYWYALEVFDIVEAPAPYVAEPS